MIRSAYEILSWYLSPKRLPWFALAEFAIMAGAVGAYEATHAAIWIVIAAASSGFGTYLAANFYLDFDRRPETKRERERLNRRHAEWFDSLSPVAQEQYRQFGRNVAALSKAGTVDMATAARNMQAGFAALRRSS